MAKSSRQKEKILLVAQMLKETDEDNVITMAEIIANLASNDICAERKSIYDDIDILKKMGMDILFKKEQPSGYYLGSREFELAELKLLVDAVSSSKFITKRKTTELVKKLGSLTSRKNASALKRQVSVANQVKSMNESIFYNVDIIHSAIAQNMQISFQYYEWLPNKKMSFRHNGEMYTVSPWLLNWDNENYYLIAYDEKADKIKYYRVDKMKNIDVLPEKREGKIQYEELMKDDFIQSTFSMFAGKPEYVTLLVDNYLAGVIIDRFGKDVFMHPEGDNTFKVSVRINVSNQFFGWLSGLGKGARIISPITVAESYKEYLQCILENYKM